MTKLENILERYGLQQFTFVDVGAKDRLDYCQELASRTVMHAFEPNPLEHRLLETRYRQHPFRHLHLNQTGLSNSNGDAEFWITAHGSMSSLLEPDTVNYAMHFGAYREYPRWESSIRAEEKIRIALQTADAYFETGAGRIDYMKLDTQGSELMILQGSEQLLASQRILLLKVEVSTIPVYKDQALFSDIDQFLRARGFVLVDYITYRNDRQPLFASQEHAHYAPCGDALYVLRHQHDTPGALMTRSLLLNWQGYRSLGNHFAALAGASPNEMQTLMQLKSLRHQSLARRLLKNLMPPAILHLLKHG